MSFNHDEKAGPQVYGGILVVNKHGIQDEEFVQSHIHRRLSEQLASTLSYEAVQKTEGEFSTEYRLNVYVLTPTQLERLVQQKAERLHPDMPTMQWVWA